LTEPAPANPATPPVSDIMAIDTVVNLWTPEAIAHRNGPMREFYVDKIGIEDQAFTGYVLEDIIARMDQAKIERGFLVAARTHRTGYGVSTDLPYEMVAEAVARFPDRFSGLAGINPTAGMAGIRDLEYAVRELGFIGAHFYPHWYEIPPDHARVYPFYAKCCELDIPIQMQVGQSLIYRKDMPLRSTGRPICLDAVACDFPELKLIGIHVGIPWTSEMIAMAWKHPNVHIISDAHSPKYWPPEFVRYIDTYGQDKVMFGTDFPVLGFERTRREIEALEIRPGSMVKFMRENARKLYRLP
jgi:predicted TIM-barrel fold metal-dependent hydrolase